MSLRLQRRCDGISGWRRCAFSEAARLLFAGVIPIFAVVTAAALLIRRRIENKRERKEKTKDKLADEEEEKEEEEEEEELTRLPRDENTPKSGEKTKDLQEIQLEDVATTKAVVASNNKITSTNNKKATTTNNKSEHLAAFSEFSLFEEPQISTYKTPSPPPPPPRRLSSSILSRKEIHCQIHERQTGAILYAALLSLGKCPTL